MEQAKDAQSFRVRAVDVGLGKCPGQPCSFLTWTPASGVCLLRCCRFVVDLVKLGFMSLIVATAVTAAGCTPSLSVRCFLSFFLQCVKDNERQCVGCIMVVFGFVGIQHYLPPTKNIASESVPGP